MCAETVMVSPETMIPDLLRAAPQVRPVLDRYGLRGCGGEFGPAETLAFFARAHDVPLGALLTELKAALGAEDRDEAPEAASVGDTIYRPFFKAGIAVILTLGAVWGAILLLRIGFLGSFTAVGIHEVNAHGHAQIYGWVGLFVMGFAYQAFPRFKHTSLRHPRLAMATLALMVAGIILRSTFEPALTFTAWAMYPALVGSVLEIAAISLFIGIIWRTLRGSGKPFAHYDYFVLSALGWFLTQAVYETFYFAATAGAENRDALLTLVATWQPALRDIQVHGFALLMILGVSHRIFPYFYGMKPVNPRRSLVALVLLNLAVAGEVSGLILMRLQGHAWAGLWYSAVLLLAGTTLWLVGGWHIYGRAIDADRSLKFMRTAYVWLFISLAMAVALPVYQFAVLPSLAPDGESARIGFSHAYYGAVRHAITVGFVSMMIVGVAAKVVPTLAGVDVHKLPSLWIPFVLINTGCAMRVGFQTLTDFGSMAFPLAGVSGILEVTGLAVWGVHLWRIMNGAVTEAVSETPGLRAGDVILGTHRVGHVLDVYPHLLPTFKEFGFTPLANPVLRRTVAYTITIEQAARRMGVHEVMFITALNRERHALWQSSLGPSIIAEK